MKDSAIQWTDHTFNPWEGCTKVAPECKNCYAETLVDHRFGRAKWGTGQPRRRTSENLWKQPLSWNKTANDFAECTGCGRRGLGSRWLLDIQKEHPAAFGCCPDFYLVRARPRVFCLSLGDWLDDEVPIEWLADLLALIYATPNLDWLLLTKRPQYFVTRVLSAGMILMGYRDGQRGNTPEALAEIPEDHIESVLGWSKLETFPPNVWIGVSAGADQESALAIPAKIHFLSCEPMLRPLDETFAAGFDWIIFGGESGKNARPCSVDWIQDGLRFCRDMSIAPFVKQLGARVVTGNANRHDWPDGVELRKHGDGCASARIVLHDSHGGDMIDWPEGLRVREFPKFEVAA